MSNAKQDSLLLPIQREIVDLTYGQKQKACYPENRDKALISCTPSSMRIVDK